MAQPPSPQEVYTRAIEEGRRRLSMPPLEEAATGLIAGVSIVFGIVALAITTALVEARLGGDIGTLAGAMAFGIGLVLLVVGRTELFSENFFDPVAAAIDEGGRRVWSQLVRLWGLILALNLVGGGALVAMLTVNGAISEAASRALHDVADEIVHKGAAATLVRAVLAGALITLLSYMLRAADSTTARVVVAYMVGFVLSVGPFDHVVVSVLHLLYAVWDGGAIGYSAVATNLALSTLGNLGGGLLLITLTHTAQVKSRR
jgi:formate-nitrite transporter family protein